MLEYNLAIQLINSQPGSLQQLRVSETNVISPRADASESSLMWIVYKLILTV